MFEPIVLHTPRLLLRPFALTDAPAVQRLAGEREIAANTLTIPHPYPDGAAEQWIASHAEMREKDEANVFALILRTSAELVGTCGLHVRQAGATAEIGYWIGRPFWGQGYATEAARAVMTYGFDVLGYHRLYAMAFSRNPASSRVLEKLGMRWEGRLRQHIEKWGVFEDAEVWGVLTGELERSPNLLPSFP